MSYLILGGTGTVGREVVRALTERGEEIRVVSRSPDKVADLPGSPEAVAADMTDPPSFEGTFAGSHALFLLNPVSQTELQEGLFALEEARRAGMEHIVYLSVQDVEKGPHLPHFASKIALEDAIKRSGIDWTILRPNNFHQNDLWFREPIVEHGLYPQPLGSSGVSRVDVRDIGEAAANAFTREEHRNRTYTLAGPDALTGTDCARLWAGALGTEVSYIGDDLGSWERMMREGMPAWMVYDFRLMYEVFQEEGLTATAEQLEETRRVVGAEPRSFEEFVEETAAGWR